MSLRGFFSKGIKLTGKCSDPEWNFISLLFNFFFTLLFFSFFNPFEERTSKDLSDFFPLFKDPFVHGMSFWFWFAELSLELTGQKECERTFLSGWGFGFVPWYYGIVVEVGELSSYRKTESPVTKTEYITLAD